jgi:hypothetical protein
VPAHPILYPTNMAEAVTVTLTINGTPVRAENSETVLAAALRRR